MANTSCAKKAARQNVKKRARNRVVKTITRNMKKSFELQLEKIKAASEADFNLDVLKGLNADFSKTQSLINKAVSKGIFHKKKAQRDVSRLNKKYKDLVLSMPGAKDLVAQLYAKG